MRAFPSRDRYVQIVPPGAAGHYRSARMSRGLHRMSVILVVAHPCTDSYTMALAEAARRGLEHAGHKVLTLDVPQQTYGFEMQSTRTATGAAPSP